jgi:acyl-CoA dehydrogenase
VDFGFNEEQEAIREVARGIFQGMVTPDRVGEIEASDDRIDRELWNALADADLLGIGIPEEFGGIGGGMIEIGLVLEEQGQVVAPIPLAATVVTGSMAIAQFGPRSLQEQWLPRVAKGEIILTAALSDLATSPTGSPAVSAHAADGSLVLDGVAMAVPFAHIADAVVVPARVNDGALVLLLVPRDTPGVSIERAETTNRSIHPHVHFTNVAIAPELVIAGPDSGRHATESIAQRAMTALALIQVGVCEAALKQTAQHLNEREQFGRPLSTFQGTMLRAADAAIDLEAIRVTAWQAAWRLDEGLDATESVLVAKWQASDRGQRVVHATQHLHGGTGADIGYPIHRYFLWGKQIELELGAPSLQLSRLGDLIANHPDQVIHR